MPSMAGAEVQRVAESGQCCCCVPRGYLNSPSSMFGHTCCARPGRRHQQQHCPASYALNFGASIEGMDNSIL